MCAAGTPDVLASEYSLSMSGGPHLGLGSGFATGDQGCLPSALGDVPRESQGRPEGLPFPHIYMYVLKHTSAVISNYY